VHEDSGGRGGAWIRFTLGVTCPRSLVQEL
jgi:hypothetical protein